MGRNTIALVCVTIILYMMVSADAALPTSMQEPLDMSGVKTVQQLEAMFPKYNATHNTTLIHPAVINSTTNATITDATYATTSSYSTTPNYWCDDNYIQKINGVLSVGIRNIYQIRTGYPPICVMWWGQLRNPIPANAALSNSTILFDPANGTEYSGWRLWKQVFYPQVDTFSLLEILYSSYYFTTTHVAIQTPGIARTPFAELQQINGVETCQQAADGTGFNCYNQTYGYVVPFMTVLIELDGGAPTNITWDQGCDTCGSDPANGCINYQVQYNDSWGPVWTGNCGELSAVGTELKYGFPATGSSATSDIKIYLGWLGTDSKSKYLTSADKRFSQFRKYSLYSAYQSAANAVTNQAPAFPSLDNFQTTQT